MKFQFKVVDLTHTLSHKSPSWDLDCGFSSKTIFNNEESTDEVLFKVQQINMPAGIGTHIDAPAHCIKNGLSVAELDLTNHHLMTRCIVIDVSSQAHELYTIQPRDILIFERQYGKIPEHTFVILHTGWEKYWDEPDKYRNNLIFPCVGADTAQLLLERNIAGIGIDTLSPDRPENGYPVHQMLLQKNKYIIENVANATKLPHSGAYSLALPMKMQDLTEAPVRLIGLCH